MNRMRTMMHRYLACAGLLAIQCAKDYNPFENIGNAQVYLLPEKCSAHIRNNDPLSIFTSETLAVYTTVREKIDSIVVRADNNRLWTITVLRPPLSPDDVFPLSYADTGWDTIFVTAYRPNNTVSTAGPFKYHVYSPLKQDSLLGVYGLPVLLSTAPVGDADVYYWWSFGTAPGDTIPPWPYAQHNWLPPSGIALGKWATGYLWVTDTSEKTHSPATAFSYEFYRPAKPVIKCTDKGLHGDTVVSSDTLVFSVQIIDSSGVGIKQVTFNGSPASSSDNLNFSMVFIGMIGYTSTSPKAVKVLAVNNVGDSASHTFYCYYETTGPAPDLVRLTLINPTTSITTTLDTIVFAVRIDNFSGGIVSAKPFYYSTPIGTVKKMSNSDTTFFWAVPLDSGLNPISVQASYTLGNADTGITITQSTSYKDTTPPVIIWTKINGKLYAKNTTDTLSVSEDTVRVAVMTFDNESGIASVTLKNNAKAITMTYSPYSWLSAPIAYPAPSAATAKQMSLKLAVANKAGDTLTNTILITKK